MPPFERLDVEGILRRALTDKTKNYRSKDIIKGFPTQLLEIFDWISFYDYMLNPNDANIATVFTYHELINRYKKGHPSAIKKMEKIYKDVSRFIYQNNPNRRFMDKYYDLLRDYRKQIGLPIRSSFPTIVPNLLPRNTTPPSIPSWKASISESNEQTEHRFFPSDFDDPDGLSSIYSTLGRMSFGGKDDGFDEEELPLPDEDEKPSTPNQQPSQKSKEPQGKTNPPMDEDESPSEPHEEKPPKGGEPPKGGGSESQPPPPIGAPKWIEAKASQLPARASWLFGSDPNLGADRHLIPTHQGAEPDTLPDAAHHPWEDPFFGWRMPGGVDRFTQQSRPMGPGDLSGMPDEEHASFGAYVAGVRAGERILTHNEFNLGYDEAQEQAAVRRMTGNPRMNTGGVRQRATGSIANWNPKLPDDL
jgi:hypothetical protein